MPGSWKEKAPVVSGTYYAVHVKGYVDVVKWDAETREVWCWGLDVPFKSSQYNYWWSDPIEKPEKPVVD